LYPILIKFGFYRQVFIKVSNINFYANPLSGRRADTYARTDVTNVIDAFNDYGNAPKNPNKILFQNPKGKMEEG